MESVDFAVLERNIQTAEDADTKLLALKAFDEAFQKVSAHEDNDSESLEAEITALEAELAALDENENKMSNNNEPTTALPTLADYYEFLTLRSVAMGDFAVLEAALRGVSEGESAKILGQWQATSAIGSDEEWAEARKKLEARVAGASQAASKISLTTADKSVDSLKSLLQKVDQLRPAAAAAAASYANSQGDTKAAREEMEVERQALLTWCRQQKTNLDAMVEPDHAQEFCSSMLANFASMDKNFQILLDFTTQLPNDDTLQKDMLECNEVWLNLQVSAYERMRHALLEVHPKSKLEDEVREFAPFTEEVLAFIQQVKELFSSTNDPDSDRFVRPVLEEADALLAEYSMHEGLPKQLQDFCTRMECLRESYSNLRRAVLSRLTFLTSSVPALTASMRRKEEYVARMKDLKAWVEVKSQGETWSDIHERILSIKSLIEQEQASLNETSA